jgi:hypothetical protein
MAEMEALLVTSKDVETTAEGDLGVEPNAMAEGEI